LRAIRRSFALLLDKFAKLSCDQPSAIARSSISVEGALDPRFRSRLLTLFGDALGKCDAQRRLLRLVYSPSRFLNFS
jgi:hypothetical protein